MVGSEGDSLRLKKSALILSGIFGFLILGLLFVFFWNFDSPGLGQKVTAKVSEVTGLQLTARRIRFNLVKGFFMEGVSAQGSMIGDAQYQMSLDRVICRHKIASLLRGKVEIETILLVRPQLEVILKKHEKQALPTLPSFGPPVTGSGRENEQNDGEGSEEKSLRFEVKRIDLTDGNVVIRDERRQPENQNAVSLQGIQMSLEELSYTPAGAITPLHALTAQGEVQVREARLKTRLLQDVSSHMWLEDGRIRLENLDLKTDSGKFHGKMQINLNANVPVYELTLDADPFDLKSVLDTTNGLGAANLHLSGKGVGFDGRYLAATGNLRLQEGVLPDHQILIGLEGFLGRGGLRGSHYEPMEIPFSIERGEISLENSSFRSDRMIFILGGRVQRKGPIDLDVSIQIPRDGVRIQRVPPQVLDGLTNDEGSITIPIRVLGTLQNPKFVSAILPGEGE